jgi:predicted MPP superfamily phosphohydrolase
MNSMAIRQRIRDFGFDLLLNESITIPKGNDTIAIIGTENWSKKKEYNYGDIPKSMKGTERFPCKIMLTHDPSFWEDSICGKLDIGLTLSGHTHASQIGFEIGDFKWSPAKYRFEQYDGLTEKDGEYILVSRGIGCVGVPVRIGLSPEYSVITLKSKKQ